MIVARRYAKALLLIGKEDGKAETYRSELEGITNLLQNDKAFEQAICNPLYTANDRMNVLKSVIEKLDFSQTMTSYLLLLFEKRRIGILSNINDFYQKLADELKGIVRASITSAAKLSSDTVSKINKTLSKKVGKEIVFEVNEDPDIIGGIITVIGDLVLDGSVKTQLLNMRESLKRGESV